MAGTTLSRNTTGPARHLNPLLSERFGWLYGRLARRLAQLLEVPVVYRPSCARPDFTFSSGH